MERVFPARLVFKFTLPLIILLGINVGLLSSAGTLDLQSIVEVAIFVFGMIGVSAVMRSDVADLKKWKIGHDSTHTKLDEVCTRLETLSGEMARRLNELEKDVYRRRGH